MTRLQNRLRVRQTLAQFAVNTVIGIVAVTMFFTLLHIVTLQEERAAIHDALDARAQSETKLQRAARGICNDHPHRAGRTLEPVWTSAGQLDCQVVLAQQQGGAQ